MNKSHHYSKEEVSDSRSTLKRLLNDRIVLLDGATGTMMQALNLKEQDFQRIFNSRLNDKESDPYKVLGADRDDSDDDIRNKWILLTKEHHPDYLIAKGYIVLKQFNDYGLLESLFSKLKSLLI